MPATIVVGAQWGDEGKGKVIDLLAAEADVVIRYSGGANAGHTVVVGGQQYVLHLVPCGILYPGKLNLIGNGVVVDAAALAEEIAGLEARGQAVAGRLFVSESAHVTFAYHRRMDEAHEAKRGADKIGTTHRGIGPTYADKFGRVGIKMGDLLDEASCLKKLRRNLEEKNHFFKTYYHVAEVSEAEVVESWRKVLPVVRPLIADTVPMVRDALKAGKLVMLEGAQGTFLDIDFGTYPYVSASNPTAGGACAGSSVPPTAVTRVIGVAKAYTTRVGAGPLPTELHAEEGDRLRILGSEYGATTGRPRRCGWFDAVVVRRAVAINGCTELAVTKLDILDQLDTIRVCTGYRWQGRELSEFPTRTEVVEGCEPVYRDFPGWKSPTTGARRWSDLPAKAREYLEAIESLCGARVGLVSVGAGREATLARAA